MDKKLEERIKSCQDEIEAALEKHGLEIDCAMILEHNRVTPIVKLVERTKKEEIKIEK